MSQLQQGGPGQKHKHLENNHIHGHGRDRDGELRESTRDAGRWSVGHLDRDALADTYCAVGLTDASGSALLGASGQAARRISAKLDPLDGVQAEAWAEGRTQMDGKSVRNMNKCGTETKDRTCAFGEITIDRGLRETCLREPPCCRRRRG